jgi:hypothetical protein
MRQLWVMNADAEHELAAGYYRRLPTIARRNRRLTPYLLWLAAAGDALVLERPWPDGVVEEATRRQVTLVDPVGLGDQPRRRLRPWAWTNSVVELGEALNARAVHPPIEVVRRVTSKLFSHALEGRLGIQPPGCQTVTSIEELAAAVAGLARGTRTPWVVKHPMGFAARERVLGRGPVISDQVARWAARRLAGAGVLLVEPWFDVVREYGVQMHVARTGRVHVVGISDQRTNNAGAATGFWLGRKIEASTRQTLEATARAVGSALAAEGYWGPAGLDALEHRDGLRPVLEINPRLTLGFVAVAIEKAFAPEQPLWWTPSPPAHGVAVTPLIDGRCSVLEAPLSAGGRDAPACVLRGSSLS